MSFDHRLRPTSVSAVDNPADPETSLVVFLDIDGVLAPVVERYRYGDFDRDCVQVLNEIVSVSGADVVVSSSLRFGKTVAQMQQALEDYGFSGRIISKTSTQLVGYSRGEEISAWLHEHAVDGFVILDDHADMGELRAHLVQTNPAVGLQRSDVQPALEKLVLKATAEA